MFFFAGLQRAFGGHLSSWQNVFDDFLYFIGMVAYFIL